MLDMRGQTDTSQLAFRFLRDNGHLQPLEQVIVDFLIESEGDFTRKEIALWTKLELSCVCGRVNSLLKKGVLLEKPRRICSESGKMAHPVELM